MTTSVPPEAADGFPQPSALFHRQRRFEAWARQLIRLPHPGEAPGTHLLPESVWHRLLGQAPDPETWLAALSQATGVYFFPSREWPARLMCWLNKLQVRRLLEAGAGRGYLSAALAPLAQSLGITFRAIDKGEGEFVVDLPGHPAVAVADIFTEIFTFKPEVVLYAWPPPGQSLVPLFACPSLRYILVAGEPGGGVTGAREDWDCLPQKKSPFLSRFCRGRTGQERHQVTIFCRSGERD
ncbi:MAG: hypothetical protein ACUVXF_05860 [Desulfobaccales bacterium]